jgi:SAM-dependent methyltransferase
VASHEQACTRVASLFASRWLRFYVGSKLRSDPVFRLAHELLSDVAGPILDIGCGVGLLAFYLRERGFNQTIVGIDIDKRKIRRAIAASESHRYAGLRFVVHDVARDLPPFTGSITIFDLVHYLGSSAQRKLLAEVATRVAPGAALLLRDSPRDGSARFRATYAAEVFAQTISWNWRTPLHFPTTASINAAFSESKFVRDVQPAWGATPFNNRLFVFRRRESVAGRPSE